MIDRIRRKDDRYPTGYVDVISSDSFVIDENNLYVTGCDDNIDPVINICGSIMNVIRPIKAKIFKTHSRVPSDIPIVAYASLLASKQDTKPIGVSFDWKTRFTTMVDILNGNQKAGSIHIRDSSYKLVIKLIDAGYTDLAMALDIETEAEL
jgi:hypothetical protein